MPKHNRVVYISTCEGPHRYEIKQRRYTGYDKASKLNSTQKELDQYVTGFLGAKESFGRFFHAIDKETLKKESACISDDGKIFVGIDAWRIGWGSMCDYPFRVFGTVSEFLTRYYPAEAPYSLSEEERAKMRAERAERKARLEENKKKSA